MIFVRQRFDHPCHDPSPKVRLWTDRDYKRFKSRYSRAAYLIEVIKRSSNAFHTGYSSTRACFVLSTDQDLEATEEALSEQVGFRLRTRYSQLRSPGFLSPTRSDLIRNVTDGTFVPSASTYVLSPRKSESLRVPVLMRVNTTSAGMLTSAAPLSTVKSNVIAPLIITGTTYVPPSIRIGTEVDENA